MDETTHDIKEPGTATPHRCWAEIDLAAVRHNLEVARQQSAPGAAVMAVVKANCYGHGVLPIVQALRDRVNWFAVANLREALEIAPHTGGVPILLLGPVLPGERAEVVRNRFVPLLSNLEEAEEFAQAVERELPEGERAQVQLKIDTGMGRMGIAENQAAAIIPQILALPALRVTGMATHFPSSDDDPEFTRDQITRFGGLLSKLHEAGIFPDGPIVVHCQNSAGILDYNFPPFVTVIRPGLMLYGSSPSGYFQDRLRPICTWKSRVALLREVPAGQTISYGRTFTAPRALRVATISAGYADGYPRSLSNQGAEVLIAGQRCAVLGRVTMDLIMADVTDLPEDECQPGAEVVLMGSQGSEEILAADLAQRAGTIAYEIFTGMTARVTRVIVS